jgi:superfamily II DNA/RNA helicase
MSSLQTTGIYANLAPEEEHEYEHVISLVRSIKERNPELGEAFILNALVTTGSEDLADQIENWSGTICEFDGRDRPAVCHGNGPRPDRIVRLKSMAEIIGFSDDMD